ncbi:unnamed protein product [Periconia digitata]|uniref:Uncharacterized protein n=1 Tax=Periconia digitata TaxID=1303443 RepID=A0A9W4U7N8_9PLEO|nr:unnamed protein product [Periconia digitata]
MRPPHMVLGSWNQCWDYARAECFVRFAFCQLPTKSVDQHLKGLARCWIQRWSVWIRLPCFDAMSTGQDLPTNHHRGQPTSWLNPCPSPSLAEPIRGVATKVRPPRGTLAFVVNAGGGPSTLVDDIFRTGFVGFFLAMYCWNHCFVGEVSAMSAPQPSSLCLALGDSNFLGDSFEAFLDDDEFHGDLRSKATCLSQSSFLWLFLGGEVSVMSAPQPSSTCLARGDPNFLGDNFGAFFDDSTSHGDLKSKVTWLSHSSFSWLFLGGEVGWPFI